MNPLDPYGMIGTLTMRAADASHENKNLKSEVNRLRAQLEVATVAMNAAVSKAEWQSVTNAELNSLCEIERSLREELQLHREAARLALEAMSCGDHGDDNDKSHRCGRCDENVDRNGAVRAALRRALGE